MNVGKKLMMKARELMNIMMKKWIIYKLVVVWMNMWTMLLGIYQKEISRILLENYQEEIFDLIFFYCFLIV